MLERLRQVEGAVFGPQFHMDEALPCAERKQQRAHRKHPGVSHTFWMTMTEYV